MLSATPSNAPPSRRAEREHRERAARVERGLDVPGQVPRDGADPARVERVDEPSRAARLDDVDGGAVVRRLDPDGLHAPRRHALRGPLGRRVDGAVVDVDPRPEPAEDRGSARSAAGAVAAPIEQIAAARTAQMATRSTPPLYGGLMRTMSRPARVGQPERGSYGDVGGRIVSAGTRTALN